LYFLHCHFFLIQIKKGIIRFCWNECFNIAKLTNFLLQLFAFFQPCNCPTENLMFFWEGSPKLGRRKPKFLKNLFCVSFSPEQFKVKKFSCNFDLLFKRNVYVHDRSFFSFFALFHYYYQLLVHDCRHMDTLVWPHFLSTVFHIQQNTGCFLLKIWCG